MAAILFMNVLNSFLCISWLTPDLYSTSWLTPDLYSTEPKPVKKGLLGNHPGEALGMPDPNLVASGQITPDIQTLIGAHIIASMHAAQVQMQEGQGQGSQGQGPQGQPNQGGSPMNKGANNGPGPNKSPGPGQGGPGQGQGQGQGQGPPSGKVPLLATPTGPGGPPDNRQSFNSQQQGPPRDGPGQFNRQQNNSQGPPGPNHGRHQDSPGGKAPLLPRPSQGGGPQQDYGRPNQGGPYHPSGNSHRDDEMDYDSGRNNNYNGRPDYGRSPGRGGNRDRDGDGGRGGYQGPKSGLLPNPSSRKRPWEEGGDDQRDDYDSHRQQGPPGGGYRGRGGPRGGRGGSFDRGGRGDRGGSRGRGGGSYRGRGNWRGGR